MYEICMVSDFCQYYHHSHPTARVHFPCYKTQIWVCGDLWLNCHTSAFNSCSLEQELNCGARPNLACCLILWITFYWYTLTLVFYVHSVTVPMIQWQSWVITIHTITKPEKIKVWSFTKSFTDPVSDYLWRCFYTFHFFPVMIAGPIGTAQFTLPR